MRAHARHADEDSKPRKPRRAYTVPIKKTWGLVASITAAAMLMTAGPAFAGAYKPSHVPPKDPTACAHQPLTQSLLPFGDPNQYTLSPGGTFSNAYEWQLRGGATLSSGVLQPDGTLGGVLTLPGNSQATSPVMCITRDYPMGRVWAKNVLYDPEV